MAAVGHDNEAGFLAIEKFLDDYAIAGIAHGMRHEKAVHRGMCLVGSRGHHHPFAGGQAVRLHHDWRPHFVDVGVRGSSVGEAAEGGGRDVVPLHEQLGELL